MFMPAARFGLHFYPGGLRRAVAALGLAQAKRIYLTGVTLRAEEMLRIGFLTELVARGQLAKTLAELLCRDRTMRAGGRAIDEAPAQCDRGRRRRGG